MANLIKTEHGLLFYDDFKEHTLMWTLSPSLANCISFTGKGLRMHHNKRYCTYTIPEPEADEYSCIVNIDHIPYNTADIAGVIVISSNKEYAECQTYMAFGPSEINNSIQYEDDLNLHIHNFLRNNNYVQWTENDEEIPIIPGSVEAGGSGGSSSIPPPGITPPTGPFVDTTYHYIKMTKTKYKYIFYASPDGFDWIEVGNVKFASAGVIGFFIYASDNEDLISPKVEDVILSDGTIGSNVIDNSHCYIKDFAIYTSKYLTFYNISRDYEFEILDNDKIIEYAKSAKGNDYTDFFCSSNIVHIKAGEKANVSVFFNYDAGNVIYTNPDTNIASCEAEKEWTGNVIKLNIEGKNVGFTKITISNDVNDENVDLFVVVD